MKLFRCKFCLILLFNTICGYKDTYDVILFVQRWYETACIMWESEEPETNECKRNAAEKDGRTWIIHGIWPTKFHSKEPSPVNCRSKKFDQKLLSSIENDLNQYWPDIQGTKVPRKYSSKQNGFWAHEWNKHGSCLLGEPDFQSEFDYFERGLQWLKSFNMYNVLAENNIKPFLDLGYNVNDIYNTIVGQIHARPILKCYWDRNLNKTILNEIRICFHKNLTLTDCDGVSDVKEDTTLTNCNKKSLIYYFSPSQGWSLRLNSYLILFGFVSFFSIQAIFGFNEL